MKKTVTFFIIIFSVSLSLSSQGLDNENLKITHGPYIQNLGNNGVTIIWTTNRPAVPGVLITGPDGKSSFIRNSSDGIVNGGGMLHSVRIEGLMPGAYYKYSVNSVQILKYQAYKIYYGDTINSKQVNFSTLPVSSDKVSFLVANDVHENSEKLGSYLRNGRAKEKDFCFFNGDMLDFLQDYNQLFSAFIDTSVFYFASVKPFYYIRGNHETRGFMARGLKEYFDYKNGRFYYSFDQGPVHFTVLDCGEDKPDNNRYYYGLADYDAYRKSELEWLREEVGSKDFKKAKYRIVMVHMPVVKADNQNQAVKFMSDNFAPLLQNAGIDLMISAHIHQTKYYDKTQSGFSYPVLVNSNSSFVEVMVDNQGIKATIKDLSGLIVMEKVFK